MKYKKTIILLALVVFLLSIAGVSASEIDNTIASENANTIELSTDNDIEDNLQTSEENMVFTSTDYDEAIAQTDTEVLGADSATYSNLANEISQPGNITLTHKNYTYDKDATAITISEANKVIDGNGAVIDMAGSTIRAFTVTASGVTIKNLTIKNAKYSGLPGGAVFFYDEGTVTNCNFTNNTAEYGGAVFFYVEGTVTNCNFVDNKATGDYSDGGAVYFDLTGTVTNCNFTNNTAKMGNAIYINNKCTISDCDFTNNPITKGAIHSVTGDITLSNNIINVDDVVSDKNFTEIQKLIDQANDGDEITINGLYAGFGIPIRITKSLTLNGQNNTTLDAKKLSKILYITANNVIIKNIQFTSGYAENGGAIYFSSTGTVTNCNFTGNTATDYGGAIRMSSGTVTNCNFTGNTATYDGGAIYFFDQGTVTNCNFADNTATYDGGAVYFDLTGTVTNCNFTNNTANYYNGGAVYFLDKGNVTNCNFADNSASRGGAIYSNQWYTTADTCIFKRNYGDNVNTVIYPPTLNVDNFTTVYGSSEKLTFDLKTNSSIPVTNGNISISVYFKDNGVWVRNYTCLSGEGWIPDLPVGSYIAVFNTTYAEFQPINRTVTITIPNVRYSINVTSLATNNKTVNITAKTDIPKNILWDGKLLFILPNGTQINATYGANGTWWAEHTFDDYDEYKVNASYVGLDNVTVNNGTITINKVNSTITLDNIVLDYGESANVTVTTTGATGITANINGTNVTVINNYTIPISGLKAGNHTLTVTTIPDNDHNPVTATSKITVNKVESTLTVDDIVFDYEGEGSCDVSFTGASEVNANVVNQPKAVVSVSGNKITVSGLAAGTYTLNVTTVPDENHTAVTETSTITVNKVNSTLTLDDVELDYGDSKNVTVATEGATGITAKIDGVNVTVSNYTIPISGLGAGNYTLTVTTIPDNNHNPITKEATITVNKLSTEITLANETLDLKVNDEFAVLADLTPAGAGNLTYSSSNESVVKVSDVGLITALGNGTSTVTVSFAGNDNYAAAQNKTISVTVSLKDSSVSAEDITLDVGVNATITSVTAPEGLEVTYIPDNSGVVTVENGVVTAVKEGTAKITLTVGGDGVYAENSTTITVTVNKLNATAEVSITENINVGDNSTVNVVLPSDATGNVTVKVDGEVVDTVPVKDGSADVILLSMSTGKHTVEIDYTGDGKYNPVNETKDVTVSKNDVTPEITIQSDITFGDNATVDVKLPSDVGGNVTLKVDGEVIGIVPLENGTASVKLPSLNAGNHTAEITYSGDDKYNSVSKTATISVGKDSTNLSAANVTATYKVNKYLVIKLTDSQGNPLTNSAVTVNLNGAKNYTTDENGQVKVKVSNLVPKTYPAKISFAGNDNYLGSEATAKVVVKKATPKITAKAKTFKTTTKTKKYTITLKDNTGKAIKNAKVTLKVNGKTYKATTNSKGRATFKITKLNKKGTFKATITYTGNKYYNKVTKKANIKVISSWKTVSKGSKDKSTVREIQQALKNHGYYLTAYGHYLMVDGVYADCTVRSVKEFQHDKGLKVTGKVDENTAKKLGLI